MINSAFSKNVDNQSLINQLEELLNQREDNLLKELFLQKSFNQFNKQYLDFRRKYKDAKWSIQPISNYRNKSFLNIKIISTRKINDQIYNLHTKQTVKLETYKNKIRSYKVVDEESILNSQKSPLIIKIVSPEKVLTGEKYEMNLIIEKPLDNSLTASGMIILKNEDNKKISNEIFGIKPNQSGGLFKYIQAPLKPGSQTISAIITHPEGIYLITKKIQVGL
ncbi:hypothetical protein [Prochlorococcus marinus]|uniref:hypothetical protein n=1 Tax=Prochlorococcus marinus TaxID=1219 RepID=UPI0022B3DBFD|nr:hypothetical protein [Prochlorococcus marinus]